MASSDWNSFSSRLQSLVNNFPGGRLAGPQDGPRLSKLLMEKPLKLGPIHLHYDRSPDFFALPRARAPESFTVLHEEKSSQEITVFFTLSLSLRIVDSKPQPCVYVGDFRLLNPRRASRMWREFYVALLKEFSDFLFYTAVLDDNLGAVANLVKQPKQNQFLYQKVSELEMLNLWRRKAFRGLQNKSPWTPSPVTDEILDFLQSSSRDLSSYGIDPKQEWFRRQRDWLITQPESLWIVKSSQGIQACVLPWNPENLKRMRVRTPSAALAFFINALTPWKTNQPLDFIYLTHLEFSEHLSSQSRCDLLLDLVSILFRQKKFHFLSLPDQNKIFKTTLKKHYWMQAQSVGLYEVLHRDQTRKINPLKNPQFEMSLV